MFLNFPVVKDDGVLSGATVHLRLKDITAVEHMASYRFREGRDEQEVVPGCVTIHIEKSSFDVKTDIDSLIVLLKEFDELSL